MAGFAERDRMTIEQAVGVATQPTNVITHVLANDDKTFSVMSHIVCEHCDYCDSQGDCRCIDVTTVRPVPAKEDPYELVGR